MGGAKAQYDCIKAFAETDFTDNLKAIDVPVLIMHGDDQMVPIADSALLSAKLVKSATLRVSEGLSHGMCMTIRKSSTPTFWPSSKHEGPTGVFGPSHSGPAAARHP